MKQKICVVVGTRPEAIKMAPLILELRKKPENFEVVVCSTGQHTTMLESAFLAFGIKPEIILDVMLHGQSLASLSSKMLLALDKLFDTEKPDIVAVHGDTASAFVASIAAFYRHIKTIHIEAGLRTHNLESPFPEEFNRRAVSLTAIRHYAPTAASRSNLLLENVESDLIKVTGNTVIDALIYTVSNINNSPNLRKSLFVKMEDELGFNIDKNRFILITAHRRENWGEGILQICDALKILAEQNPKLMIVYPVHLNPNVKTVVERELNGIENIILTEPKDYVEFSWLLYKCHLVLTDSGGIQEEAPALGKPVLVLRDTSERPEAIDAGTAILVGTEPDIVVNKTQCLLDNQAAYDRMVNADNPFGNGTAAVVIVEDLLEQVDVISDS